MKVWVCFLVGLVIGVGVSVAAAEHYPRPWENASWVEENGHMYDFAGVSFFDTRGASLDDEHELIVEGLLNESIPDFQDSLEEMELEALSLETIRRGEKDKNLGQALYHFGLAGEIDWSDEAALVIGGWDACADIGSDIGGTVGTAAGAGVGAAAGAGVGAAASAGTGTAVGTGVGAVVGTGVGFVVGETLGGLLIGGVCAGAGASAGLVSQQLDAWNYPENWKNCANYALYSLESKGRRVNNLVELFEAKEELMRSGGVCDSDYAGPGLEYCGVPLPDVDCNHSGLWDSVPGFSWYYNCTQEHWETIDSLEMIVDGIALSYNETIEQCGETKGLVASRKEEADLVMSGLAAERLEVITLGGGGENGALSVQ